MASTTLSNHLNGGRIPEEQLLQSFYKVVEEDAASRGLGLPHLLDNLQDLRRHALVRHCPCCRHGGQPPAQPEADPPADPESPASPKLRVRANGTLSSQTKVPVPQKEGDRHPKAQADVTWTELGVVTHYLSTGRKRDANVLLWRAGMSLSASEVLNVVTSCRSAGLDEAAETVLTNAGERADKQAVLNITAALQRAGRHEDVSLILAAATQIAD
ncbi:hypothetical protein [Streptomyces sp. SYSU K21746]